MPSKTTSCRSRRGVVYVEFAFTFILFTLVLVALMELGRGLWAYSTIVHASRQAGRYCMVRGSANPASLSEIDTVIQRNCIGLEAAKVSSTSMWNPDAEVPNADDPSLVRRGDVVQITVNYDFPLVTGRLILAGAALPMTTTTRMIVTN